MTTTFDAMAALVNLVKTKENVTFPEIAAMLAPHMPTEGEYTLSYGRANVFFWTGMSREFLDLMVEATNTQAVYVHPASPLLYTRDGCCPVVPMVCATRGGVPPEWIPICFCSTPFLGAVPAAPSPEEVVSRRTQAALRGILYLKDVLAASILSWRKMMNKEPCAVLLFDTSDRNALNYATSLLGPGIVMAWQCSGEPFTMIVVPAEMAVSGLVALKQSPAADASEMLRQKVAQGDILVVAFVEGGLVVQPLEQREVTLEEAVALQAAAGKPTSASAPSPAVNAPGGSA